MGVRQPQNSAEGSADSSTTALGLARPLRTCRQQTSTVIEEQLLEDVEEHKLVVDRRTLRLKEKNKRAQQRFRERQKEKSQQAVAQVRSLQEQVAELRSRATAAQNRCHLLEKMLSLREGEGGPQQSEMKGGQMHIFAPYSGFTSLPDGEFVMQLTCSASTSPALISREQVLSMDLKEHSAHWKACTKNMAVALEETNGDLQSPAARHLQGLVNELFAWCSWTHALAPHTLAELKTMPLDGSPLAEPQPLVHLLSVLKSHGLSQEQENQLVAARRFCLSTLANLMRERLIMEKTLKQVISGGSSWNNMHASHACMVEMQQRLARNVEAESHAFHTFMNSALRRVLNPIQTASILVSSFPFMPNIMGVVALLSGDEAGEGSDDDLLQLDPMPLLEPPLAMVPAGSLGMSLDALWDDIFLS